MNFAKVTFKPIYSADMPARIPVSDLLSGLARSLMRALGCWVHYTAVALAWLGFVPLVTCRIYYSLFRNGLFLWVQHVRTFWLDLVEWLRPFVADDTV